MMISRNDEIDAERYKVVSYIFKRYCGLLRKLTGETEVDGVLDTDEVKSVLLEMQNGIHDDLMAIVRMECKDKCME